MSRLRSREEQFVVVVLAVAHTNAAAHFVSQLFPTEEN